VSPRLVRLLLGSLIVCSLGLRLIWLDYPGRVTIQDEGYYLSAVHKILYLPPLPNDPYPYSPMGVETVIEHPIGGKLLIAASTRAFGDHPFAWRLPSALFGTGVILLVFLLARRLTGDPVTGLVAAVLIALDPMMLVHSRMATIEMFVVGFVLAGLYAYVEGRPILAGLLLAAAACCKLTGAGGLIAVVLFEAGRQWGARSRGVQVLRRLQPAAVTALVFAVAFPALLWALNSQAGFFKNPFDHLFYMYTYLSATFGFRPAGEIPTSRPWEWLWNAGQYSYLRQGVLDMRAVYNPLLIFAAVPVLCWAAVSAWRTHAHAALMVLAIAGGCYLPLVAGALQAPRHTYLYYFLPTLPAVAIGVAAILRAPRVPRPVLAAYLAAAAVCFVVYFPFRGWP
jgi:predicted membrane-bound dolichyl-phosphate-mannose-protein mannosyltransferase